MCARCCTSRPCAWQAPRPEVGAAPSLWLAFSPVPQMSVLACAASLHQMPQSCLVVCRALLSAVTGAHITREMVAWQGSPACHKECGRSLVSPRWSCPAGKGKKGGKAKEGEGEQRGKKGDKNEPPAPPSYPDIAVCNATGALHHLSFLDAAKVQVRCVCGMIEAGCRLYADAQRPLVHDVLAVSCCAVAHDLYAPVESILASRLYAGCRHRRPAGEALLVLCDPATSHM